MVLSRPLHFGCMTLSTNARSSGTRSLGGSMSTEEGEPSWDPWRWQKNHDYVNEQVPGPEWVCLQQWHGHWDWKMRPWHSVFMRKTLLFQHHVYHIKPVVWDIQWGMSLNTFLIEHLRYMAQNVIGYLMKLEHVVRQCENYRDPTAGWGWREAQRLELPSLYPDLLKPYQ